VTAVEVVQMTNLSFSNTNEIYDNLFSEEHKWKFCQMPKRLS